VEEVEEEEFKEGANDEKGEGGEEMEGGGKKGGR